jgi:putative transposase
MLKGTLFRCCLVMGKKDILWQDTSYVSTLFAKTVTDARKSYADYVSKCAGKGRRPELTGGGLIRPAGGWRAIRAAYKAGIRLTSDERILDSSSFVEKTPASAGEAYDRRMRLKASGIYRSSVSRAMGRVQADPALKNMSKALLHRLYPEG